MRSLGLDPSEEEIEEALNEVDQQGGLVGSLCDDVTSINFPHTGDGTVTFTAFLGLMAKKMQETDAYSQIRQAFRGVCMTENARSSVTNKFISVVEAFDPTGKGTISVSDLRQILRNLDGPPSEAELREMIQNADPDENGVFQYAGNYHCLLHV